jgi:hypothetical protein
MRIGPEHLNAHVVPEASYEIALLPKLEARRVIWARVVADKLEHDPAVRGDVAAATKWTSGLYERNYVRCLEDLAFVWRALEDLGEVDVKAARAHGPGGDFRSRIRIGTSAGNARVLTGIGDTPPSWYVSRLVASLTGTRLAREVELLELPVTEHADAWFWCADRYAEAPEEFADQSEMRLLDTQMRSVLCADGTRRSVHPGVRDRRLAAVLIDRG